MQVRLVTCTPYRRSIGPVVSLIEDGQHLSLGVYRRGHLSDGALALAPRTRRGNRGVERKAGYRGKSERRLKEEKAERREEGLGLRFCSVPLSGSWRPCSGNSPSGRLLSGLLFPAPPQRNSHDTERQRKWTSLAQRHTTEWNGREPCQE